MDSSFQRDTEAGPAQRAGNTSTSPNVSQPLSNRDAGAGPMGDAHALGQEATGSVAQLLNEVERHDSLSSNNQQIVVDHVDGHTLSSVPLSSVGCPDPSMLSNIFQDHDHIIDISFPTPESGADLLASEGGRTVPTGMDRGVYTAAISLASPSYSTFHQTTTQSFPSGSTLANVTGPGCFVSPDLPELSHVPSDLGHMPDLSLALGDEEEQPHQLEIPLFTVPSSMEDLRLDVLAKTWTSELSQFLTDGCWTDVDIRVPDAVDDTDPDRPITTYRSFRCHRLVLAAASSFLAGCFNGTVDDEPVSIILPDFSTVEVEDFLSTLYLRKDDADGVLLKFLLDQRSRPGHALGREGEPEITFEKLSHSPNFADTNSSDAVFGSTMKFERKSEVKMEDFDSTILCIQTIKGHKNMDTETESKDLDFDGKDMLTVGLDIEDQDKGEVTVVRTTAAKNVPPLKATGGKKPAKNVGSKAAGPFTCHFCGKTFRLLKVFREHEMLHGEPQHQCPVADCGRKFHTKTNLKCHIDVVHLKKKNFPCELCGKLFYNASKLKEHSRTHSDEKYICQHCMRMFSSQKSLGRHIKSLHTTAENLPKCKECGKQFATGNNLKLHVARVHLKKRNFSCHQCGKQFFEYCELEYHIQSHGKEKLFPCDICNLKLKSKKSLTKHIKLKHCGGERKYICHQCGKAFIDNYHLKRHLDSHKQKTCLCPMCGKGFGSESIVQNHARKVHDKWGNKRPNKASATCQLCGKEFVSAALLQQHQMEEHKTTDTTSGHAASPSYILDAVF